MTETDGRPRRQNMVERCGIKKKRALLSPGTKRDETRTRRKRSHYYRMHTHTHTHTHSKLEAKKEGRLTAWHTTQCASGLGGRAAYSLTGGVSRAMMTPMMTRPATGPV